MYNESKFNTLYMHVTCVLYCKKKKHLNYLEKSRTIIVSYFYHRHDKDKET